MEKKEKKNKEVGNKKNKITKNMIFLGSSYVYLM